MMTSTWDAVWARARAGKHTVILGPGVVSSVPSDLIVVQVSCQAPWTVGGPLDEALRRVIQLVGDDALEAAQAAMPPQPGLRSWLLDTEPGRPRLSIFVEACNQLVMASDNHAVLCFEALEAADASTVATLGQLLQRPGWLRLPIILAVHGTPQGAVATLVEAMHQVDSEAVVLFEEAATRPTAEVPFAWTTLSPDVLRVLRAGAVLGPVFEAALIARLLNEPVERVLETLQRAVDAGVPLSDRGEGRFLLPAAAVEALRQTILPSLLSFWNMQLGDILRGNQPETAATTVSPAPVAAPGTGRSPRPPVTPVHSEPRRPLTAYADLFEPASPVEELAPEQPRPPVATEPPRTTRAPGLTRQSVPSGQRDAAVAAPPTDQARAAAHLQAAGQTDTAAAQYLVAMQQVAARGDAQRAYALGTQALQLLDGLPKSERRLLLRAQILLELGHVQWQGAMLGVPFTLADALTSLQAARAALPANAPLEVSGRLATVTAGVCYDLGDMPALQEALKHLDALGYQFLDTGERLQAACLLNEQAAVWIRLGDPGRATLLLSRSRELFTGLLQAHPEEPVALAELAATEHLLARLPLHARLRPERAAEAYTLSLAHAQAAEQLYQRLGHERDVARVWETMGRLTLAQGQFETAQRHLAAALESQQQSGDMVGLARSTAALADLYLHTQHHEEAAALLADSVLLNFEKGSPLGLAFNRRTFEALQRAAQQLQGTTSQPLRATLQEIEQRLTQAEAVLGPLTLPGEGIPRR